MMAPIRKIFASPYFWFGLGLVHTGTAVLTGKDGAFLFLFGVNAGALCVFAMADFYVLRRSPSHGREGTE